MALPVAPVLSFKRIQVARCFKPSPAYCCLTVPLLWHVCLHKYYPLRCLNAKAVAQADVDAAPCAPVALGCARCGMG